MPVKTVAFPRSTARSRSQTVNLPNVSSIVSVTVNTGNVSYSLNGENLTVNVSGGSHVDYGTYTPSRNETDYRTTSAGGDPGSLPSSISYNSGGYSGTLTGGSAYVASGTESWVATTQGGTTSPATLTHHFVWDGSSWSFTHAGEIHPGSIYYTDASGFSGTIPLLTWYGSAPNTPSKASGEGLPPGSTTTRSTVHDGGYHGTLYKTIPDSRVWRKDYSGTVYGPTEYTYYYAYTVTIEYVDRVDVGKLKVATATGVVQIPIYKPDIGMSGVNQLRVSTSNGIACFELVNVTDPKASNLRVMTPKGIKSVVLEGNK